MLASSTKLNIRAAHQKLSRRSSCDEKVTTLATLASNPADVRTDNLYIILLEVMKTMPNVYIPNNGSGHDFSAAQRYGTLIYLSEGPISKYAIGNIYRTLADKLRESHADDYILQTSLTTMNMVATACFVKLHNRLNLLLYKNNTYVKRVIVLSDLMQSDQDGGSIL